MDMFTASLLFKSYHSLPIDGEPLWEEIIVLVEAVTEDDALEAAKKIGVAHETEYKAEAGDIVSWKFEKVESVCRIDDQIFRNGTELFSRFLKDSEVHSILQKFD